VLIAALAVSVGTTQETPLRELEKKQRREVKVSRENLSAGLLDFQPGFDIPWANTSNGKKTPVEDGAERARGES
jgi:hypothetical protein